MILTTSQLCRNELRTVNYELFFRLQWNDGGLKLILKLIMTTAFSGLASQEKDFEECRALERN